MYPNSFTNTITSFTVAWTSLRVESSSGADQLTSPEFAEPAILDSGTTITLLPADIAYDIYEEVGASVSQSLGAVVVPCDLGGKQGNLTYQFGGVGGPSIAVQISELVLPLTGPRGRDVTYSDGTLACQLGIQPTGSDTPTLFGDTFLRSAYAVYDLYNNKIALAPTIFNVTDTNVVAFESLGAAIPSASTAPSETAVTQSATGIPRITLSATGTDESQPTYDPTATGFNAASGFQSRPTGKKSSAGRIEPFDSSILVLGFITMVMGGMGSMIFIVL